MQSMSHGGGGWQKAEKCVRKSTQKRTLLTADSHGTVTMGTATAQSRLKMMSKLPYRPPRQKAPSRRAADTPG